jgi:hypothetical protein
MAIQQPMTARFIFFIDEIVAQDGVARECADMYNSGARNQMRLSGMRFAGFAG